MGKIKTATTPLCVTAFICRPFWKFSRLFLDDRPGRLRHFTTVRRNLLVFFLAPDFVRLHHFTTIRRNFLVFFLRQTLSACVTLLLSVRIFSYFSWRQIWFACVTLLTVLRNFSPFSWRQTCVRRRQFTTWPSKFSRRFPPASLYYCSYCLSRLFLVDMPQSTGVTLLSVRNFLTFFLTTDLSARWLTIQPSSFSAVVSSPFFGMYWKYTSV